MARVDYTRQIIADALIGLMQNKKFDSISVNDIVACCDLSRHTFYYHFEDKYALLSWILDQYAVKVFPVPTAEEISNGRVFYIREIIDHMYENKAFYTNAISSSAQNVIYDNLYAHIYNFRTVQINGFLRGRQISDTARHFICSYFTCSISGLILQWARTGMMEPKEFFFRGFNDIAAQSIEMLIDKYTT